MWPLGEQAFVGRTGNTSPLKTTAWEARVGGGGGGF